MKTRRVHTPGAIAVLGLALAISATASLAQSSNGDGDYKIGPQYKLDPDLTDRGNPKGKSFEFSMLLADSKIFRGDDPTLQPEKKPVRKERRIYVYVPAAYKDGPCPIHE